MQTHVLQRVLRRPRSLRPPKAQAERLRVAVSAARRHLRAARHRIPRRLGPLDPAAIAHCRNVSTWADKLPRADSYSACASASRAAPTAVRDRGASWWSRSAGRAVSGSCRLVRRGTAGRTGQSYASAWPTLEVVARAGHRRDELDLDAGGHRGAHERRLARSRARGAEGGSTLSRSINGFMWNSPANQPFLDPRYGDLWPAVVSSARLRPAGR